MSALGFFRRNTKMVIIIMVGLMVAFIFSSVVSSCRSRISQMGDDGNMDVAVLDNFDQTLTAMDIARASNDLKLYKQFGLGDAFQAASSSMQGTAPVEHLLLMLTQAKLEEQGGFPGGVEPLSSQGEVNWAILCSEAKARGFSADGVAVDAFLAKMGLVDSGTMQPTPTYQTMLATLRKQGILESQIRDALANLLSVVACFNASAGGDVVSEAELRKMFADLNSKMNLAVISFDAGNFVDGIEINEDDEQFKAEIAEMFDSSKQYFRDDVSNPTEYRFGYRLPRRVSLEYAFVSMDSVAAATVVSDDEIHEFWSEDPSRFYKHDRDEDGNPKTIETTYAEVKSQVRKQLRSMKAAEKAKSIAAGLIRTASQLQEDETEGSPSALAGAVERASSSAISYAAPGRLLSSSDIRDNKLLGRAMSEATRTSLAAAAFSVDSFAEENETSAVKEGRIVTQPFAVNGSQRGYVVWRVTGADEAHAPEQMTDQIANEVRADWVLKKAYAVATEKAAQAAADSAKESFKEIAEDLDTEIKELADVRQRDRISTRGDYTAYMVMQSLKQMAQWMQDGGKGDAPQMLPAEYYYRFALSQPYVWSAPALRELGRLTEDQRAKVAEAAFALAIEGENTTDKPAPAGTVAVVELPTARKVLLIQALAYTPAYGEDYDGENGQRDSILYGEMMVDRLAKLKAWASTEQIELRSGYKMPSVEESAE